MEELINLIASRGVVDKVTEILEDSFGAENVEVAWLMDYNVENFLDGYYIPELERRGINIETIGETCTYIKENCFDDFYEALINNGNPWNTLPQFIATIRFPHVTVTNEYGDSTDLENVFIIITFLTNGLVRFELNLFKTTFTFPHFIHGYVHSHRPTAYTSSSNINEVVHGLLHVESCCLGDGPINQTFEVLGRTYSEEQWIALCWDIQKYVETESLTGGPYIKLTQGREIVNKWNNFIWARKNDRYDAIDYHYNSTPEFQYSYSDKQAGILIDNFIKYLMENKLIHFSFDKGKFAISTSPVETYCIISTELLRYISSMDWSNVEPEMIDAVYGIRNTMERTVCDITGIYTTDDFSAWEEKRERVLEKNEHITFKGQDIPLVIEEAPEEINSTKYFNSVGHVYVWYIVYRMLSILNLNYGLNRPN